MNPDGEPLLRLRGVEFAYPGQGRFLGPIDFDVGAGQLWAIIGPNGAGKSTLLRLCAGLLSPQRGRVQCKGAELATMSLPQRARLIAFLPQHPPHDLSASARELVLMGRFPHRRLSLFESPDDHVAAEAAMRETDTLPYADRALDTLSGGEAQRVHLAAALAQRPAVLALDEPTASLDLYHQLRILGILRRATQASGVAVVAVMHDVNLARRFCTHAALLNRGQLVACGPPADVVLPAVLEPVYEVGLTIATAADTDDQWIVPRGESKPNE